jgi:5-methylcytosine-specific restriction endonuclease McrA
VIGFPKPVSRLLSKLVRQRKVRSLSSAVKRAVRDRDGGRCRVCHGPGQECHELRFRSLGGAVAMGNTVYVCRRCHRRLQEHKLLVMGTDANRRLTFVER